MLTSGDSTDRKILFLFAMPKLASKPKSRSIISRLRALAKRRLIKLACAPMSGRAEVSKPFRKPFRMRILKVLPVLHCVDIEPDLLEFSLTRRKIIAVRALRRFSSIGKSRAPSIARCI